MTTIDPVLDRRPDGSLTPINYLDGKTACTWAFLLATREQLVQARDDLDLVDPQFTDEHLAILDDAHRTRFGRPLPHR